MRYNTVRSCAVIYSDVLELMGVRPTIELIGSHARRQGRGKEEEKEVMERGYVIKTEQESKTRKIKRKRERDPKRMA